ncbi:MAG: type III pantothenate kinase [Bacteroidales bacterium]|jgi:type III pantothenate kinase|nr:type III pantothenate kinase [Bacteroidales bacterium]
MNLIIDIGNTLQKIAVFENDEIVYFNSFQIITDDILQSVFAQFEVSYSIISSVADTDANIVEYLKSRSTFIRYTPQTKLPITILYETPETLGLDRIAGAVGAAMLFTGKNVLSIQAGTCLVFDFVNDNKEYLGGSISPGLKMRFEALHEKTKKLPLINSLINIPRVLGTDTLSSLSSGVINGLCYEIDGFIENYKIKFKDIVVLISGGDAKFIQNSIKNTIFAAPNVVLKGLNEIIKYNV